MGKPKVGLKDFMESASLLTQADWQRALTSSQTKAAELFGRSEAEQTRLGYFHTLREICQQPWTWLRTCERMVSVRDSLSLLDQAIGNHQKVPHVIERIA